MSDTGERNRRVGPVLTQGRVADAVAAAIEGLNEECSIRVYGGYLRVTSPDRCLLTREAVEARLGRAFRLPGELEAVMSSFAGFFSVTEERAVWTLHAEREPQPTKEQ